MGKRWKIGLGILVGAFAAAHALHLDILSSSTPRGSKTLVSGLNRYTGSVLMLVFGIAVSLALLRSAFAHPRRTGHRTGRRAVRGVEGDGSARRPQLSSRATPKATQPDGRYFFLVMALLCLTVGGVGLAFAIPEAIAESRLAARTIPTTGTVVETRITQVTLPPVRRVWRFWQKEGLVEFTADGRSYRQWLVLDTASDRAEVPPGGAGETFPLWYDPAADEARMRPPDPVGWWLRLAPLSAFAVVGLLCLMVMTRLLLKGAQLTSGVPDNAR